ncbi:hypothetical protein ABDK56_05035 [Sphingomonas sp. ASV193]|uniref:hypothetical protein n=1 Tax=Sphingomonas sp. ASV193 TaxID=3144405 RepID=UPI0032E8CCB8
MSKFRMGVLIAVIGVCQSVPAFSQIAGGGGGGGVPGPEIGAGVIGMGLAMGAYRFMRRRIAR